MNDKKYVFIVQVTRQLCVDILNEFADKNACVELYTGEISNSYNDLNKRVKVHLLCKYDKRSSLKRIFTWSGFTVQVFLKLLFKRKDSELIFITTPPFTPFVGLFFKKVFRQNYHLIIWDLYPEALLSLKNVNRRSIIYRAWAKANKSLFNKASSVITIGQHMAKAISKYFTDQRQPKIIFNWIDTHYIHPIAKADNWFADKYNQLNKLTILYSGNMGDTHDFESLLKVAEQLEPYKDICFLMIGEGTRRQSVKEYIEKNNLTNMILLPLQDKGVLPFSLTTGDIGVVTLGKEIENVSVPSKTYAILASGNAMLALGSKDSELALIVNKYNCGQIFENRDVKGIADFILSLYNNRELLQIYKTNSRIASMDFTPHNALEYYKHISRHSDKSDRSYAEDINDYKENKK